MTIGKILAHRFIEPGDPDRALCNPLHVSFSHGSYSIIINDRACTASCPLPPQHGLSDYSLFFLWPKPFTLIPNVERRREKSTTQKIPLSVLAKKCGAKLGGELPSRLENSLRFKSRNQIKLSAGCE
jgi:hypothetical protein